MLPKSTNDETNDSSPLEKSSTRDQTFHIVPSKLSEELDKKHVNNAGQWETNALFIHTPLRPTS